jgi:hypothetical protein
MGGVRMHGGEYGFDVLDNLLHDLRDALRFRKSLTLIWPFVTWL